MPAFTFVVAAVVLGLLLGSMLVVGAPYLAVPTAAVGAALLGWLEFRRRRQPGRGTDEPRHVADEPRIEFTERDRETLVESEGQEKADGGG